MALSAVPSKVLKSFIGLEETEPIVRSTPTVSKYQSRSHVDQLVTMRRSKVNPLLTTFQSKSGPNSTITVPRNLSATCVSRASMCSITEDIQHKPPPSSQGNKNCSDVALRRKGAMKKPYSPWRTTVEIDDTSTEKEHAPLRRAFSADVLQNSLSPYNPDKPLIKNFPLKKLSQMSHLARARSIKTTIGPLTKEVCEQLNILVESDNHNKVALYITIITLNGVKNV